MRLFVRNDMRLRRRTTSTFLRMRHAETALLPPAGRLETPAMLQTLKGFFLIADRRTDDN